MTPVLLIMNVMLAVANYYNGNYIVAMFCAFAAGMLLECLMDTHK